MCKLNNTICFKLMFIRDKIHEYAKPYFQEIGITYGNYITLLLLYENPGITQVQLSEINHKDKNVIVQTLDNLEDKNYVKREKSENHRRAYALYLTKKGEEVVEKYWNIVIDAEKNLFKDISDEELALFKNVINKLCI